MPLICYVKKRFNAKATETIRQANAIIAEFREQGFTLTLRQLYYQFVARELIANNLKSYKRLGHIISEARLAGLIDWEAIEDRTRFVRARPHWEDPAGVIDSAAHSYGVDLWEGQDKRVEVWIEKDALVGVAERICRKWDVPLFSCRGYASQSELWRAAGRLKDYGCEVVVLHLGDHDPSGKDMTRDIEERLHTFGATDTSISRIALNMAQVRQHKLPPNPAKVTDSRFEGYRAEHGDECWELDALNPKVIEQLIDRKIRDVVDVEMFEEREAEQERERKLLKLASAKWPQIATMLRRRTS